MSSYLRPFRRQAALRHLQHRHAAAASGWCQFHRRPDRRLGDRLYLRQGIDLDRRRRRRALGLHGRGRSDADHHPAAAAVTTAGRQEFPKTTVAGQSVGSRETCSRLQSAGHDIGLPMDHSGLESRELTGRNQTLGTSTHGSRRSNRRLRHARFERQRRDIRDLALLRQSPARNQVCDPDQQASVCHRA